VDHLGSPSDPSDPLVHHVTLDPVIPDMSLCSLHCLGSTASAVTLTEPKVPVALYVRNRVPGIG
jgi:hypothetical protein